MPLRDHFHPPLSRSYPWTGIHSAWAVGIVRLLNGDVLPEPYYALPRIALGGMSETDDDMESPSDRPASWEPPAAIAMAAVDFTDIDEFEVQVYRRDGERTLGAAIELVSPNNKEIPGHRRAFAVKCADVLRGGASLVIIDAVTEQSGDPWAELLRVLEVDGLPASAPLFATALRTARHKRETRLEVWPAPLAVGEELPTVPVWIEPDLCVPLNLEASYREALQSLRIR